MDEHQWLSCGNLLSLLISVIRRAPVNRRKLQLFACACCRLVWHFLGDERSRLAVEAIEGLAGEAAEAGTAFADAEEALRDCAVLTPDVAAHSAALTALQAASPPGLN